MNKQRLKQAEEAFFKKYPGGFYNPEMIAIGKKHNMDKHIAFAQEHLSKKSFSKPDDVADNLIKLLSRSSMVSMFEKPKFRDLIQSISLSERGKFINGLEAFLYGKQEQGFNAMLGVLQANKLAKWSLMTIVPNYVQPLDEVFVKPTTAKGVIKHFELDDLDYKPLPSWSFYQRYRETILTMRTLCDASLAPNNAAFCGFLMMSLKA